MFVVAVTLYADKGKIVPEIHRLDSKVDPDATEWPSKSPVL